MPKGPIPFSIIEQLESRQFLAAHIVGSATVYQTIQAAVDAAAAGATINVDAGTYNELVTVDKKLTLHGAFAGADARATTRGGAGESIVRGQDDGTGKRTTAFRITANDVTLDGFTVEDNSSSNQFGAGIVIDPNVAGTHIVDNIVQHNVAGVYLASSSATDQSVIQHNLFVANNTVGENSGRAIYSDGGVSGGNLTNVLIDSNTFKSNVGPDGIEAAIGLQAQTLGKQSNITISNNIFGDNGKAVLLINASNVTIKGNLITGSIDEGSAALRIEGGVSHATITLNTIANNKNAAIRIDKNFSSADNSDISITQNNIFGNAQGGLKVDAGAYTGTLDARNNYWGSASGPGGDGTGTGDAIFANGNAVLFAPFSTTLIAGAPDLSGTVTQPPTTNPPPVTQPPPTTNPPPVHHKKKHSRKWLEDHGYLKKKHHKPHKAKKHKKHKKHKHHAAPATVVVSA